MNKKTKLKLNETLNKALETPKRKNLSNLDALLSQYENPDHTQTSPKPEITQTIPLPGTDQTQTTLPPRFALTAKTIAPKSDYNKRANILERDALPAGLFPGSSKAIYDAIYLRTLGAVVPKQKIQATRKEIMEWSGIKNIKTVNAHLKRLEETGLIKRTNFIGEQSGSHYEIHLPNESKIPRPDSDQTQTEGSPKVDQKMDSDQTQKMVWVGLGKPIVNKDTSGNHKTFFKTLSFRIDDDAPIIEHLEKLNEMARKLTGKDLTKKDLVRLADLTEILVTETVIAAARTGSVSASVAFMTENLRRRLYSKPRPADRKGSRSNHLKVGKESDENTDSESSWVPQTALSEEQRQNTLNVLKEAKAMDGIFFREFKAYGEIEYTSEDFNWLLENLEKGS